MHRSSGSPRGARLPMPPPGVAARCDGHSLHARPRKSHTTICTAHEEADVPTSPSQKVLQGPPGDALQVSQPLPPQFLRQHCCWLWPRIRPHRRPRGTGALHSGLQVLTPPTEIRRHVPRQNTHLVLFDQRIFTPHFLITM